MVPRYDSGEGGERIEGAALLTRRVLAAGLADLSKIADFSAVFLSPLVEKDICGQRNRDGLWVSCFVLASQEVRMTMVLAGKILYGLLALTRKQQLTAHWGLGVTASK